MYSQIKIQKTSLPVEMNKIILEDFNVSRQTVYNSLNYSNNS